MVRPSDGVIVARLVAAHLGCGRDGAARFFIELCDAHSRERLRAAQVGSRRRVTSRCAFRASV
jgi:hypothetical protein